MQGERGLADAALLIEEGHDHRALAQLANGEALSTGRGPPGWGDENDLRKGICRFLRRSRRCALLPSFRQKRRIHQ
jgi:hypothetical protein